MKRFFLFLTVLLLSFVGMAQTTNESPLEVKDNQDEKIVALLARIDTLMAINNELLIHLEINTSLKERYKLYLTDNIYTLLQLDTKTGRIEQVQWSSDSDNEGSVVINGEDLSYGYGSGTFELYPSGFSQVTAICAVRPVTVVTLTVDGKTGSEPVAELILTGENE